MKKITTITVDCLMRAFTRAEVLDDDGGDYTPMSDKPLGLSGEYKITYSYPTEIVGWHDLTPDMSAIDVGLLIANDCKVMFAARDDLYFESYTLNPKARTITPDVTC